jgi:hypothetical protein
LNIEDHPFKESDPHTTHEDQIARLIEKRKTRVGIGEVGGKTDACVAFDMTECSERHVTYFRNR